MVLGEGLLEDGTPEGLILRDCGEEGSIATSLLCKRQVVIDDDRVGQTEGEEVHSVDTVGTQFVVRVDENLLHAAWNFSESGSTRDEPAIAEITLNHIFVVDAIGAEKSVSVVIDFRDSLPIDFGEKVFYIKQVARVFTHIFPVEGSVVVTEVIVTEFFSASVDAPEVVERSLVAVLRGHTVVGGGSDLGKFLLGDV